MYYLVLKKFQVANSSEIPRGDVGLHLAALLIITVAFVQFMPSTMIYSLRRIGEKITCLRQLEIRWLQTLSLGEKEPSFSILEIASGSEDLSVRLATGARDICKEMGKVRPLPHG
jgi:hypothetical protein